MSASGYLEMSTIVYSIKDLRFWTENFTSKIAAYQIHRRQ
jgi:hypothetical protein